jgi:hypothetical protein
LTEKSVTIKGNKALGVKYELDRTKTRAADHYHQAQFDNTGSKKDRIGGPPKDCHCHCHPTIPGKFEVGMRSRSDLQNNVIFRIAPNHDPIRQKPDIMPYHVMSRVVGLFRRVFKKVGLFLFCHVNVCLAPKSEDLRL